MGPSPRVVVAGLGSEYRRDDGAGPLVAERAVARAGWGTVIGPLSDPLDLLGEWDQADLAVIVDAVHSDRVPGTLTTVNWSTARVPSYRGVTMRPPVPTASAWPACSGWPGPWTRLRDEWSWWASRETTSARGRD